MNYASNRKVMGTINICLHSVVNTIDAYVGTRPILTKIATRGNIKFAASPIKKKKLIKILRSIDITL